MKLIIILVTTLFGCSTLATRGPPPRPPPSRKSGSGWGHGSGHGWGNGSGNGWGGGDNTVPSYETPPPCLDRTKIPIQNHYDSKFFENMRPWYITGASEYEYINAALKFLGRLPRDQNELNEMCYMQIYGAPNIGFNTGYGREYQSNCTASDQDPNLYRCAVVTDPDTYDGNLGVKPNLGAETSTGYMVKTDSYSYAIYYICDDGRYAHLQLTTTRPYVHPKVANIYIDLAKSLGFHVSEFQLLSCQAPHFKYPYPYPFQNYPHSPGNEQGNGWGWIQEKPNNGWGEESFGWEPASVGWGQSHGWGQNSNSNGWASHNNGWGQNSPGGGGWSQNNNSGGWGQGSESGWQEREANQSETEVRETE